MARLNLWKCGLDLKIWAGEVGRGAAGGRHLILFFKRYLHSTHTRIMSKLQGALYFKNRGARYNKYSCTCIFTTGLNKVAEEQTGLFFVQIKDSIASMELTITVGSGSLGLPLEVVHYSSSPVTKKCTREVI